MYILPESPVRQQVPLWKMLPVPTPAHSQTGPLAGPGFFSRAGERRRSRKPGRGSARRSPAPRLRPCRRHSRAACCSCIRVVAAAEIEIVAGVAAALRDQQTTASIGLPRKPQLHCGSPPPAAPAPYQEDQGRNSAGKPNADLDKGPGGCPVLVRALTQDRLVRIVSSKRRARVGAFTSASSLRQAKAVRNRPPLPAVTAGCAAAAAQNLPSGAGDAPGSAK